MEDRLIVRAAVTDDVGPLAGILNEIIQVGGTTALETPLSQAEFTRYFLHGPDFLTCYVAQGSATRLLVGFQALARHPDLPERWADIATFARMNPKLPGVGTALFAVTRMKARKLGLIAINAAIRADNRSGLAFYEKMGFRTYRTLHAIPLKNGMPIDRVLKRFDVG